MMTEQECWDEFWDYAAQVIAEIMEREAQLATRQGQSRQTRAEVDRELRQVAGALRRARSAMKRATPVLDRHGHEAEVLTFMRGVEKCEKAIHLIAKGWDGEAWSDT